NLEVIGGVEELDYKALYNKTVADPSTVDGATLSLLINRYPYAQSLRFIEARKLFQENGKHPINDVLLYTNSPNWLQGYLIEGPPPFMEDTQTVDTQLSPAPDEGNPDIFEHPAGVDYFVYAEQAQDTEST